MTVQQIIELLKGYMEEKVPISIQSLINTLNLCNEQFSIYNEGSRYTNTCNIVIHSYPNKYSIVIMNNKVIEVNKFCNFETRFDNFFRQNCNTIDN